MASLLLTAANQLWTWALGVKPFLASMSAEMRKPRDEFSPPQLMLARTASSYDAYLSAKCSAAGNAVPYAHAKPVLTVCRARQCMPRMGNLSVRVRTLGPNVLSTPTERMKATSSSSLPAMALATSASNAVPAVAAVIASAMEACEWLVGGLAVKKQHMQCVPR